MKKNEIDNQNQSHFDSIIDLNRRIVTPLVFCLKQMAIIVQIAVP